MTVKSAQSNDKPFMGEEDLDNQVIEKAQREIVETGNSYVWLGSGFIVGVIAGAMLVQGLRKHFIQLDLSGPKFKLAKRSTRSD